MPSVVTPPQRKAQRATELTMDIQILSQQIGLLSQQIFELGARVHREIEHTDPTPPANVVRFPQRRDAA